MAAFSTSRPARRHLPRTSAWKIGAAVVGVIVAVELALVRSPRWARGTAVAVAGDADGVQGGPSRPTSAYAQALSSAWKRIDALGADVQAQGIVAGFGRGAESIVKQTLKAAGMPSGRDADALTQAVDGALEALFQLQLHTLRDRAADRYEELLAAKPNPYEAGELAQQMFQEGVADLVRPGSSWDCKAAQKEFLAWLRQCHGRDTLLVETQGSQGQGKQVTIEVIKRLQQQSAAIQREADARGAFPWNVKWQYFLDRQPLGFRGQYSQGRSIVELLLMPHPGMKNNILNKIGPLNLAVGFDLFL